MWTRASQMETSINNFLLITSTWKPLSYFTVTYQIWTYYFSPPTMLFASSCIHHLSSWWPWSSTKSVSLHPYVTTGKTIALTRWTFVGKVMSLLFNMLSRLVIAFLPRSKHLLISWLQSPSTVILKFPKIKSDTVSTVSSSICHEVMGPDAMILVFWMLSFKLTFSLFHFHQEAL